MNAFPLKPIQKKPKTFDLVAFDTEGTGAVGDFRLAATYDASGGKVFAKPGQLHAYLFQKRFRDARILAVNLEYDCAVAFQPFSHNWEIVLTHGKWLAARYRDGNHHTWTLWDLLRIAPISVAEMGQILGLEKWETPPALFSDRPPTTREWFCDVHHKLWCVECYCLRDAEITYKFGVMIQKTLNDLGGELRATAASCAMDLFRRRFLTEEIAPSYPEVNEIARFAYYGGRVECLKPGTARNVQVHDFNSLYPSVMRDLEIPLPHAIKKVYQPTRLTRYLDKTGVFVGTVRVPDSYVTPLPQKYNHRVVYPYGDLKGVWTLSELRLALENGSEILSTDAILYANETKVLFREWVDTLYALRQQLKMMNRPDEYVIKMMLNSLSGKFGQRSDGGLATLVVPRGNYDLEDFADCEPSVLCNREVFLREREQKFQSPYVHVLWVAEILAQARRRLFGLLQCDPGTMFYTDTDSIHTTRELENSAELGRLKLERTFQRVTYYAPKEYGGIDTQGKLWTKVKGIPARLHQEYLERGRVEFARPNHTLTALRDGLRIAEWRKTFKERRTNPPTRDHAEIKDYNQEWVDSRALSVEEVELRFGSDAGDWF